MKNKVKSCFGGPCDFDKYSEKYGTWLCKYKGKCVGQQELKSALQYAEKQKRRTTNAMRGRGRRSPKGAQQLTGSPAPNGLINNISVEAATSA